MSKDDQSAILMSLFIFFSVYFTFSIIGSAGKAWFAFYHQVILKDQVVGTNQK
jgi:hypothetical protein